MAAKRPTQRTMEYLRDRGHIVQVVEKWVSVASMPGGGIRRDLFNGIDVVALIDNRIVGIQCGATSGHSAHKKKLLAEPRMQMWLQAGGRLLICSWAKQGPAGKAKRWTLREEELTLQDFEATPELDLFT